MAKYVHIEAKQGATFNMAFKVPVDLTGHSGRMFLKRDKFQEDADLEITTLNGRMTITPPAGEITYSLVEVEIEQAATDILIDSYYFDFFTDIGVIAKCWSAGEINFCVEVSK